MRIIPWMAAALSLTLFAGLANAQMPGFQVNSIAGVGVLEDQLDDRLSKDFMINLADCQFYLGETDPVVADEVPVDTYVSEPEVDIITQPDLASDDIVDEDLATDFRSYHFSGKEDDIAAPRRILLKWSVTSASGYDYAIKIGSCSESGDLTDEETDSCQYLVSQETLDSYTNNELYIDLWDLLPDGCAEGDTGETALYFFFQYGDDTYTKEVETVKFYWDFDPPVSPQNVTLEPGEENIKVDWDDEVNSEDVSYRVYWSSQTFQDNPGDGVDSKGSISTTSYQISGLAVGTTYFVGVTAVDDYDNESVLSDLLEDTPVSVDDFWEHYKKSGGKEQGGYCFIATAAFGSPMQPAVVTLRGFRDRVLLPSAWGRALVDTYYTLGPLAARYIQNKPLLRSVVRGALVPVIVMAWLFTEVNPIARYLVTLMFFLGVAMVLRQRRRLMPASASWRSQR